MYDTQCVSNSKGIYLIIVGMLRAGRSAFFAWTDKNQEVQFDIFMSISTESHGPIQGGLKHGARLMVGIVRVGFFGFRLDTTETIYPKYISEKLCIYGPIAEEIATLISEVRRMYQNI